MKCQQLTWPRWKSFHLPKHTTLKGCVMLDIVMYRLNKMKKCIWFHEVHKPQMCIVPIKHMAYFKKAKRMEGNFCHLIVLKPR